MNLSPDLIESVRHIGARGMVSLNCTALSKAIAYVATLPTPKEPMNLVQQVAAETVVYGGVVATRAEVYADCIRCGWSQRWADVYAFGQRLATVDPASVAHLPTLAQAREAEAEEEPFREWCGQFLHVYRARTGQDYVQPWDDLRKYFNCNYMPESAVYAITNVGCFDHPLLESP